MNTAREQADSPRQKFIKRFEYIPNENLATLDIYLEADDYQRANASLELHVLGMWSPGFEYELSTFLPFSSKPFSEYQHLYGVRDRSQVPGELRATVFGATAAFQMNVSNKSHALHFAALAGNEDAMRFLMAAPYHLDPKKDIRYSGTALHWAAFTGQTAALRLLVSAPYYVKPSITSVNESTALRCAIERKHRAAAAFLMDVGSNLHEKDRGGNTILHSLVRDQKKDEFDLCLTHYPEQVAACWTVKNKNGETIHELARGRNNPLLWLRKTLLQITKAIAQGDAVDAQAYKILEAFADEWRTVLLNPAQEQYARSLYDHIELFTAYKKLKRTVVSLREALDLQAFDTIDKPLSLSLFTALLVVVKKAVDKEKKTNGFFSSFSSEFITKLKICFYKSFQAEQEQLGADTLRTINVIISDHERSSRNDHVKSFNAILAGKLLATSSIAALRPRATMTAERDISEANYLEHFEAMKQQFSGLAVSADVRRIINKTIFPGILHLIEHRAAIVQHVTQHYGVMYYLAPGHKVLFTHPPAELSVDVVYFYNNSQGTLLYSATTSKGNVRDRVFNSCLDTVIAPIQAEMIQGNSELNDADLKQAISVELRKSGVEFRPDNLPLHTDHAEVQNPEEFDQILHRLLKNIIGAYYCCETAGQLPEFFNRLSSGYCLEGRVRDLLQWAIGFSEIKSMDAFMADVIADYGSYMKVMKDATEEDLGDLDEAVKFIVDRYKNFPCEKSAEYAPKNRIRKTGVERYLTEVLCYEQKQKQCLIM
ncbi:MAG: ankyrin repeat domain-containing protein [Legionellaceae bacterium]|nr:ankyrin repeat domain-containing protein [Legionellaceae bacterium]